MEFKSLILQCFHFLLTLCALVLWGSANFLYSICFFMSILGDFLVPNSVYGNCWSFALSRWWKNGGYLLIRESEGNKFMRSLPLPHVIWVKKVKSSGVEIEHFVPEIRKRSNWFPWYAVYFKGKIITRDRLKEVN